MRATRRVDVGRGSVWMSTTLSVLSSSLRRFDDRGRVGVAEADRGEEVGRRRVVQFARRSSRSTRRARHRCAVPTCTSSLSSISWPSSAFSSLRSLRNHCLILCLAPDVLTIESQSSDGRALDLLTSTSTDVAVLQAEVERHDLAVDLRADAVVADVGVHLIGEVERRRARRQREHVALGREDEHLDLEQVELEVLHEHARVAHVVLPLEQRAQPGELLLEGVALRAFFVAPVRGDAVLARCGASRACGSALRADRRPGRRPSCAATGTCWAWASRCSL